MKRVEAMAVRVVDNAMSRLPHSVSAFRAIRELVEPETAEPELGSERLTLPMFVLREVYDLASSEKHANARELPEE
jgi:hypothetical protein